MSNPRLVIVSNRGPVGFSFDGDRRPVPGAPAGGLATGLRPLLEPGTAWIAAAVSEPDRAAARLGDGTIDVDGLGVRLLDLDANRYRLAYDVVANATLWYLHHGLWDLPRQPVFDAAWYEAWEAYRGINDEVADAVAAEVGPEVGADDAIVLVQDYHLALVAGALAERGVNAPVVHFSHTPFAGAEGISVLPQAIATELLEGMAACAACGFHTERWAARFRAACVEVGVEAPRTFTADLAPDVEGVRRVAAGRACQDALAAIEATVGDGMQLITRVDRLELSKNVVRGFLAYESLLARRSDLREQVVFAAFMYRSREGLDDYRIYEEQIVALVDRINVTYGSAHWTPVVLDIGDDFPRSVAALRRYDVLLVNPVRDGLNLVAFEGPAVNERNGVLCLSTEAGAFESLADVVEPLDPFDIESTASALERALDRPDDARRVGATRLLQATEARDPQGWLEAQIDAASG